MPKITLCGMTATPMPFVLAAEDDIRIPDSITPCALVNLCQDTFQSYPNLDILSLGHSWKSMQKVQKRTPQDDIHRDLFRYLQDSKGAGVHGATLFAIRFPEGVQRLQQALERAAEPNTKQAFAHFDQFLFYSLQHDEIPRSLKFQI